MFYDNEKLNEIYRDTWPNLGWAKRMDIHTGDTVRFIGCSKEQILWGSNDDPNLLLFLNDFYYVERVEVHSQHTKIEIRGLPGKKFNSVCFEVVHGKTRKFR